MTTRYRFSSATTCAWLAATLVACTVRNPNRRPDAAECAAETDTAFCARVGATCEDVTGNDNCGTMRAATCGTCSGTDACVANACKAPVCSALSFPHATLVSALNDPSNQDALAGVSADGNTVLWQRSTCFSTPFELWIADATAGVFAVTDITGQPALAPLLIAEERTLTLTADGLTIIGVSIDHTQFLQTTRAAIGSTAFGPASNADFAALNVTAPAKLQFPAISSDGLALYFRLTDSPGLNGLYETVRASKAVPFPAATKMPGPVQNYESIMGIASDRMALFVQNYSFRMAVLTRKSLKDPFANPNAPDPAPVAPGFRTRPFGDCHALIGNSSSNACLGEEITIYTK